MLIGLEEEYRQVYDTLASAAKHGESSSCIVIGPRASGKTSLVTSAVADIRHELGSDAFAEVKLSGYALSDDRMALREISRQLDTGLRQYHSTYQALERRSLSETIRAVLEVFDVESDEDGADDARQPPNHSDLDAFKSLSSSKTSYLPVLFIIDEIDRFALQQSRQTLLYALLEICQSSQAPIALVGITCRANFKDSLEKRVRSRLSQRVVHVARPRSLSAFWTLCRAKSTQQPFCIPQATLQEAYELRGNLYEFVKAVYYTTASVRDFLNKAYKAYNELRLSTQGISQHSINAAFVPEESNWSTQTALSDLSQLELVLIICAARVEIKYSTLQVNFNLVYEEYRDQAVRHARDISVSTEGHVVSRVASRAVSRAAWFRLQEMDLVVPTQQNQHSDTAMARIDVGLMELAKFLPQSHWLSAWTRL